MNSTSVVAMSSDDQISLPSRYEIRHLTKEHAKWATAIWRYTYIFNSPVWSVIYPEHKAQRLFACMGSATSLIEHGIASGMSYGVFDTEYKFKRSSSEPTGGALYWDELEEAPDATPADFLEGMDFPLVSIALAYDGFKSMDSEKLTELFAVMPTLGTLFRFFNEQDPRGDSWKPKAMGEVLLRIGTNTRPEYEGERLMGNLARFLMQEARLKGYRAIQIASAHDAVTRVWTNPPAPCKSEVIMELDMATYEQDGQKVFAPSKQVCSKMYVTL